MGSAYLANVGLFSFSCFRLLFKKSRRRRRRRKKKKPRKAYPPPFYFTIKRCLTDVELKFVFKRKTILLK